MLQPFEPAVFLLADVPGDVFALVGAGAAAVFTGQLTIITKLLAKYVELVETRNREAQLQIEKSEVVDANDALKKRNDVLEREAAEHRIQLAEARRRRSRDETA